ncbi:MAG: SIS domain-containing protein [Kiloniellales bacterium]
MSYVSQYLEEAKQIVDALDQEQIEKIIQIVLATREKKGRIFFIGVGGSAANCTHAVNDFRKIGGVECYTPVDNVAELTARTNDEGWETTFGAWLETSHIDADDVVWVFSVGGGDKERNVSANIVNALDVAKQAGARVVGVVGRDGGHTAKVADACVIVKTVNPQTITPHAEAFQGTVWHLIVSDPRVMTMSNKWEGLTAAAVSR